MIAQILPFTALFISTFLLLMGNGLGNVLVPLRATAEGWSTISIGWIGTSYALAFTLGCFLIPFLVRRVGHVRVHAILVAGLAASMLMLTLATDPIIWAISRGLTGFSVAGAYMVIESWLNDRASNENRGLIFSAYMVVNMAGLTAGQYVVPLGDVMTTTLFVVGSLLYLVALIPTSLTLAQSPRPLTQVSLNLKKLYKNSGVSVIASFLSGAVLGIWMFFAPVFGQQAGLSSVSISTMLAAATLGGVIFQFPIGQWSDKVDRRVVITAASATATLICFIVPIFGAYNIWLVFAVSLVLGGMMFPLYSLIVAHANDHADEGDFVAVSSGLLIIYGIGNMIGPQIGGRMISLFGSTGFFLALAAGFGLTALYTFWRMISRDAVDPEDRADYQMQPINKAPTPQTYELDPRSDIDFGGETSW